MTLIDALINPLQRYPLPKKKFNTEAPNFGQKWSIIS